MTQTVFEKIGGSAALDLTVHLFYRKLIADDRVASYFDGVDLDRQIAKQKAFLSMVLGGPARYEGRDLRDAHRHMNLNDDHVDAILQHLRATLEETGVDQGAIEEVLAIADSTRAEVLNR